MLKLRHDPLDKWVVLRWLTDLNGGPKLSCAGPTRPVTISTYEEIHLTVKKIIRFIDYGDWRAAFESFFREKR